MLRRRRREGEQPVAIDDGQDAGQNDLDQPSSGPWDIADDYPQADRFDCGSLLIPIREGFDVQINVADEEGSWVAVVNGESGMQLQAFAAPRSGGLWDEVRQEIADNIAETGGSCRQEHGPLGPELHGEVPVVEEGAASQQLHPIRFIGYDGPRWFLRGVISGPAATDRTRAAPFEEIFADVVVVRGDYPAPQRQQLEIRLPEEVQRAIDAQAEEQEDGWSLPDPFTRGPEITETR